MSDDFTRKLDRGDRSDGFAEFLTRWQATIVSLSGDESGTEHVLDRLNFSLGRGDGVDLSLDDSAMSREHAAFEFVAGGFRIRDLGSMNGTLLNGSEVKAAELKNGDRIQLGEHSFQFVLEERPRAPKTYVLPDA